MKAWIPTATSLPTSKSETWHGKFMSRPRNYLLYLRMDMSLRVYTATPDASFGSPADLFIIPDHYVTRMLYSQGIPLDSLLENDHREIWRIFCQNFHLFRGTPTGIWLMGELASIFGIEEKPNPSNADRLFDLLSQKLQSPKFSPRKLFESFHIEVLATTDSATDSLEHHRAIRASGWHGRIIPTFRPDLPWGFTSLLIVTIPQLVTTTAKRVLCHPPEKRCRSLWPVRTKAGDRMRNNGDAIAVNQPKLIRITGVAHKSDLFIFRIIFG